MKTRHPESLMQQAFINACWHHPVARRIYAIPNGGKRSRVEASIMKAEGVKAGMPDTHLPVARGGANGLYIEFKHGDGRVSPEQKDRLDELHQEGHAVAVVWTDWTIAWRLVQDYLAGKVGPCNVLLKPEKAAR